MFWLNKEDGEWLMDEVVRMGQARRNQQHYYGPSAEDLRREVPIHEERSRNIRLALQHKKLWTDTDNERKKLRRLYCQQHHLLACQRATRVALESVLDVLARESGESREQVAEYAHKIMRKAYDTEIDRHLDSKVLSHDPRDEGPVWAIPMRSWYAALQSRQGRGPAQETDRAEASEVERMRKETEACLQDLKARQYGPSEHEQRRQRLDVAKAESLRIGEGILKLRVMFADAQVKLVLANYHNHDLSACVLAAMAALVPALEDQAKQTGKPLSVVQEEAYALMRQTYDAYIDKALALKKLLDDPRKDATLWTVSAQHWYRGTAN